MPDSKEENTLLLYANFGITEWPEKCQILTTKEKIQVLKELKKGVNSYLVQLVKLPFPAFAEEYFKPFEAADIFFEDSQFAYKLYFLDGSTLRIFTEKMRTPNMSSREIIKLYNLSSSRTHWRENISTLVETPFEDFAKINNYQTRNNYLIKFIQIARYIDLKEAHRLDLPIAETFEKDGVDGYEIGKKLSRLNPALRKTLELYLGLYGYQRHYLEEISQTIFGITYTDKLNQIIKQLLAKLLKTTGEFEHFIGYREELQTPGNYFEYVSQTFKDFNIHFEILAIINSLPSAERQILSFRKRSKACDVYLASKYMYKTPESLARNFCISTSEAKNRLMALK